MSRAARAAAALVLGALLVGCSDDPRPDIAPAPSPTPTVVEQSPAPSASTPATPAPPAEMSGSGPRAAEAFVRHFWEVANYSQAALDPEPLARLSADGCQGCTGAIEFLRGVIRAGGTIKGGTASVTNLSTERLTSAGRTFFSVTFDVTNTRQVVEGADAEPDQVFPATTVTDRFVVDRTTGTWQVGLWEVLG